MAVKGTLKQKPSVVAERDVAETFKTARHLRRYTSFPICGIGHPCLCQPFSFYSYNGRYNQNEIDPKLSNSAMENCSHQPRGETETSPYCHQNTQNCPVYPHKKWRIQ